MVKFCSEFSLAVVIYNFIVATDATVVDDTDECRW